MKRLSWALPLFVLIGCAAEPDVTYLQMPGIEGLNLPFSSAVSRGALGANGLALNARVEIECIAITD